MALGCRRKTKSTFQNTFDREPEYSGTNEKLDEIRRNAKFTTCDGLETYRLTSVKTVAIERALGGVEDEHRKTRFPILPIVSQNPLGTRVRHRILNEERKKTRSRSSILLGMCRFTTATVKKKNRWNRTTARWPSRSRV